MPWQFRDHEYRHAIRELVAKAGGRCALAGTTGVQIHLAAAVGTDKPGPPAHAIELVPFGWSPPAQVGTTPVIVADALGFESSVQAGTQLIDVDGESYPVAQPEHILGMALARAELRPDVKWACFILMRTYAERLDLEEVRGFLKRAADPERQVLLAELAYLAA